MAARTMRDLFVHALSDAYSAEKQLRKALPKMACGSTNADLAADFQTHLEETHGQIGRIDQIVEECGIKLTRIKCVAMEELVEEGQERIEEIERVRAKRPLPLAGRARLFRRAVGEHRYIVGGGIESVWSWRCWGQH